MTYVRILVIFQIENLLEKGYEFISAQVKLIPQTTTVLSDEAQAKAMEKLVDMLEDDDDVQNVFHNWEQEQSSI